MTGTGAFQDLPRTARGHMALLFHEAVHGIICAARDRALAADRADESVFEQFPFLTPYFEFSRARMPDDLAWDHSPVWFRDEVERWTTGAPASLPMRRARDSLSLSHSACLTFACAGLVEEDARFTAIFAALQQPHEHRRPTLGLCSDLFGDLDASPACQTLLDAGLLDVPDRELPRAEWELRVPGALWRAAIGECGARPLADVRYWPPGSLGAVGDLILPDQARRQVAALPALLASAGTAAVVLRGTPGSERLEVLGAVAGALGRGVVEVRGTPARTDPRTSLLGSLCTLAHAMPVFVADPGPGETCEVPELAGYNGPCGLVLGMEGGVTGPVTERAAGITLPPDTEEQRARHWRRALQGRRAPDLDAIVSRFALPGRYIRQSAEIAAAHAALAGRDAITVDDVREAARAINRQQLDTLAERLDDAGDWSQLVVSAQTLAELRALEHRCRHRETLVRTLGGGLPGGMNRGVRALLEGPSGCGKTLAARTLASTALGLDLYRVNLSAVVDKYIGETEKKLSRVLSRAEELDVVLLLDEGDGLLARRSHDVRSSTDKYANQESGFLLTRLETYTGVILITTNAASAIDPAFRRRFDAVIKFSAPDAEQRWQLWLAHLPHDHGVDPVALERIAVRYELTGGQIRNAAISAVLRAMSAGAGRVGAGHLEAALQAEYRKAGAAFPLAASRGNGRGERSLDPFLSAIT